MKSKYFILSLFFAMTPLMAFAQYYSGEVGKPFSLPEPTLSGGYVIYDSKFFSTSSHLYVEVTGIVEILSEFSGHEVVQCDYYCVRQYVVAGQTYRHYDNGTAYYYISCVGGGGNGGGGSGGGGGDSNDGWNNNDFFQDKTIEGHSMWFFVGTRASDNKHVAIVSPHDAVNSKSCVSQSTTGKVTIPETAKGLPVISIWNASFYGLTGVTEVVIPKSVEYVNTYSFLSCEGLKKITCLAETPPNGPKDLADYGVYFNTILYVPKGCKSKYTSAKGWENFKTIKEIGDPDSSSINEVQLDSPSTAVVYTISGQRIEKPHKGINIIGGKKIVVK